MEATFKPGQSGNQLTQSFITGAQTTSPLQQAADNSPVVSKHAQLQQQLKLPSLRYGQLDFSQVPKDTNLERAVAQFDQLEQADLTKSEFDSLKTGNRFMPLFGRFMTAHNTKLLVKQAQMKPATYGLTELLALPMDGSKPVNYDDNRAEFQKLVTDKAIERFVVVVTINSRFVKPLADIQPFTNSAPGRMLQAFSHEMTVHAENMLDFINSYWDHVLTGSDAPTSLPNSSEEHKQFKDGNVSRYEYMSARAKSLGQIGMDFSGRESEDKGSAM